MSMADDYGCYDWGDIEGWRESLHIWQNEKGEDVCMNCDSTNIKVSQKGNKYCADLCWVEEPKEIKQAPPTVEIKDLGF